MLLLIIYLESIFAEVWLGLLNKLFKLVTPCASVVVWPCRGAIGVVGAERRPNVTLLVDLK